MDALILCGIVSLCGEGGKKNRKEKEKLFSEHHFSFLLSFVAEGLFSPSPPPSSSSPFTPSGPASWTLHLTFAKTIWKAWGSSRRENDCVVRSLEWRDCNSHPEWVCVWESVLRLRPNHRIDLRLEVRVKWLWGFRKPSLSFIYTAVRASSLTSTSQPIHSEFTLDDIQARVMSR